MKKIKKMKKKIKAFALTIIVTLNLVVFLIMQNIKDIVVCDENCETIWSLITFMAVLGLAMYLLNLCFENND